MRLGADDVEAIAQRVAELLAERPSADSGVRYLDAAQLAEVLGVERDWVYAHSGQLGAIRLGGGRGRLRFDLQHVQRTLAADGLEQHPTTRRQSPKRRRPAPPEGVELIPYAS